MAEIPIYRIESDASIFVRHSKTATGDDPIKRIKVAHLY